MNKFPRDNQLSTEKWTQSLSECNHWSVPKMLVRRAAFCRPSRLATILSLALRCSSRATSDPSSSAKLDVTPSWPLGSPRPADRTESIESQQQLKTRRDSFTPEQQNTHTYNKWLMHTCQYTSFITVTSTAQISAWRLESLIDFMFHLNPSSKCRYNMSRKMYTNLE